MKKEICIDARMGANSGIGTYIRALLPRLKDSYHLRILIHPETSSKCPELKDIEQIPIQAPIYSIQEQMILPQVIPKCDLFWSPHFNIPLLPIRAKKRLVTIHDVLFLAHPEIFDIRKRIYAKIMFKAAAKQSHHVITDSQFSFSEILKYVGPYQDKMTAIPLGVDSQSFHLATDLQKPNLTLPAKYILYVGNLAPHKNIIRLIQSLDFLPQDVHLVLVGKETHHTLWKKEAKQRQSRVILCGRLDFSALVWLYRHAELLIHPSLYEGFGLTPLEAMSAGCPVVASRIPCLEETCGDAAVFVDPLSPQSIAAGIASVWENPSFPKELQMKGSARVQQFCWDKCAEQHRAAIENLLLQA